jgi:hypothetical protein
MVDEMWDWEVKDKTIEEESREKVLKNRRALARSEETWKCRAAVAMLWIFINIIRALYGNGWLLEHTS